MYPIICTYTYTYTHVPILHRFCMDVPSIERQHNIIVSHEKFHWEFAHQIGVVDVLCLHWDDHNKSSIVVNMINRVSRWCRRNSDAGLCRAVVFSWLVEVAFGGGNRLWRILLEHSIVEMWIRAEITRLESVSKRGGRRTILVCSNFLLSSKVDS